MKHPQKYIQIRHWDYWWSVYQCGQTAPAAPNTVECSLTDDEEGGSLFFHFDLFNLPGLRSILREGAFLPADHPDHPDFHRRAEALERGETDYFVGALYYRDVSPDLAFCNLGAEKDISLLDLRMPPASPYYAVLFLAEERSLEPEVLTEWMRQLSRPLFGEAFSVTIANVPTRGEALAIWQSELTV